MEVLVTMNCADKQIKIKLSKLLKFDYFKKMLNFGSTKMLFEETKIIQNNYPCTMYTIGIPELYVDCDADMLIKLLTTTKYDIYLFNKEYLLALMMYIDMYQIDYTIRYCNGFDVAAEFWFVEYIKQELPTVNPFKVLQNAGFNFTCTFIEYGFALIQNNLTVGEDLLDYLDYYLMVQYNVSSPKVMLDVLKSIPILYEYDPDKVKNLINTVKIKHLIVNFCKTSKIFCNISNHYITQFNETIDKIFILLEPLDKILLIKITDFNKNTYQFIT